MHLFPALAWDALWRLPMNPLLDVCRAVDQRIADARKA
jgi:hypothetical protein